MISSPDSGPRPGREPWPLDPEDATELPGLADHVVTLAQQFSPHRCRSTAECFALTRDVRETVQLMISRLEQPGLLDVARVSPWMASPARGEAWAESS